MDWLIWINEMYRVKYIIQKSCIDRIKWMDKIYWMDKIDWMNGTNWMSPLNQKSEKRSA
jgi:hypothetical protein